MKKLGKGIVIFFLVIISLCVPFALLLGVDAICEDYNNGPKSARKHISFLTGIDVPQDAEIVYHFFHQYFQGGEIIQYTVFSFEADCSEWLQENKFQEDKSLDFEKKFNSNISNLIEDKVSKEFFPDFTKEYLWFESKRAYFIYIKTGKKLIVYAPTHKAG